VNVDEEPSGRAEFGEDAGGREERVGARRGGTTQARTRMAAAGRSARE
jgi:hypothetical protein